MFTIMICDDNVNDLEKIYAMTKEWSTSNQMQDICIQNFLSPYDLIQSVSNGNEAHIFLLDILMPEMTGIALGQQLQSILVDPLLIYLTSSEDYYPDAFTLYAFQYLCKPILKNQLFPVLDKASKQCSHKELDFFVLKTSDGILQLPLHQIIYVELLSHICHFHLSNNHCLQSIYLRTGFEHFIAPLLKDQRFVRTHAAFVINLQFARKFTKSEMCLIDGTNVPLSRKFSKEVQKQYMSYALREGVNHS